jgi:hypothetical protein
MKISAVLIRYQRPKELTAIIRHLEQFDFIDEVLIRDNRFINHITYGRYEQMKQARNEFIYVQDDDCIVNNLQQLYDEFVNHRGLCMVNNLKRSHIEIHKRRQDSLVGWGTIVNRQWASVLDWYIGNFGKDAVLLREADRIFTYLCPATKFKVVADITDFDSAMSTSALSLQHNHFASRDIALERCKWLNEKSRSISVR